MKEKIQILFNAGVITKEVADFVNKVIDYLEGKDVDLEKMDTFITHLAMASQRVIRKEELTSLPDDIYEQVKSDERYPKALKFYEEISKFTNIVFPEDEYRFVIMHLCNMLKK